MARRRDHRVRYAAVFVAILLFTFSRYFYQASEVAMPVPGPDAAQRTTNAPRRSLPDDSVETMTISASPHQTGVTASSTSRRDNEAAEMPPMAGECSLPAIGNSFEVSGDDFCRFDLQPGSQFRNIAPKSNVGFSYEDVMYAFPYNTDENGACLLTDNHFDLESSQVKRRILLQHSPHYPCRLPPFLDLEWNTRSQRKGYVRNHLVILALAPPGRRRDVMDDRPVQEQCLVAAYATSVKRDRRTSNICFKRLMPQPEQKGRFDVREIELNPFPSVRPDPVHKKILDFKAKPPTSEVLHIGTTLPDRATRSGSMTLSLSLDWIGFSKGKNFTRSEDYLEASRVFGPFVSPSQTHAPADSSQPGPIRCDQGLYMGFTNIIETIITCAVHALLLGRPVIEFPDRIQHKRLTDLLDADSLHQGVRAVFGLELRLVDAALFKLVNPSDYPFWKLRWDEDTVDRFRVNRVKRHMMHRNELEVDIDRRISRIISPASYKAPGYPIKGKMITTAHQQLVSARPWARLYLGDVWVSRINTLTEVLQLRFFARNYFAPAKGIAAIADSIVAKVAAEEGESKWIAVHLRMEKDRWGMGKSAAAVTDGGIGAVVNHVAGLAKEKHISSKALSVYYASGELAPNILSKIPPNWIDKDRIVESISWKDPFDGRWFDGKPVEVTNATGSVIDLFVLLRAPFAVVSEFSSFGEVIAAARCGLKKPTWLYNTDASQFTLAPCADNILFQRSQNEAMRKEKCESFSGGSGDDGFLSRKRDGSRCSGPLNKALVDFRNSVEKLTKTVDDRAEEMRKIMV